MYIKELELNNFRNYEYQKIIFNKNINTFFGDNAQGKTNVIESIFLSAFGKSFRTKKENELIKYGKQYLKIDLKYQTIMREEKISISISNNKNIYINGIKIKRLSELLGKLNVVLFTPDDINILRNGPSQRRRFLDMLIGQIRPNYVYCLNRYLKILEQRNIYLKEIKFENKDENLLDIWDEKLVEYSIKICQYRMEYINKIKNKINKIHNNITDNKEEIEINYLTDSLNKKDLLNNLRKQRKNDINKGFTSLGIQRDDFNVYINKKLVNIYGSQGQNRTVVLSLKICELQIIRDEIGENPILLLDDFMSELDIKRRNNFLKFIDDVQIILTCTEEIKQSNLNNKIFFVNEGKIAEKDI